MIGTGRIRQALLTASGRSRKGFIPFTVAGDPTREDSLRIARALVSAGADVIELGVPWTDPIADGPQIQRAMERALEAGMTLERVLDLAREIRSESSVPIAVVTYANPAFCMGYGRLAATAAQAGVDGILVWDMPIEEADPLDQELSKSGLELLRIHAPATPDERSRRILALPLGFLTVIARMGVTGTTGGAPQFGAEVRPRVEHLRSPELNPHGTMFAVGFGISKPEQIKEVWSFADAVVVGSALSDAIGSAIARGADPVEAVIRLAAEILPT